MDFYVSNHALPGNPGTKNAPFSSPEEARDAVRKRIGEGLTESVTVHLLGGEYRTAGIAFDARDSGTPDFPVVWQGDGEVTLNGGLTLDPGAFTRLYPEERARLHGDAPDRVLRCDLRALGLTPADWGELCAIGTYHTGAKYDGAVLSPMWCELFVNGVRQEIARYPNEGFLFTGEPVREGDGLETAGRKKHTVEEWAKLKNPVSDIYTIDADTARRAAGWKSLNGVWMFGYPMYGWADMSTPVVSVDPDTCRMETAWVSLFGMKTHAPYYFYNVFEELDSPGEWYLDRDRGVLYIWPAVPLEDAKITLSLLTGNLLRVRDAGNLVFRNIAFTGTRGDALDLEGSRLTVKNCTVRNVAGWGILLAGSECAVRGCEIERTGKGGIRVTGGDRATLTPSGHVIEENHIHHIAEIFRTYNPAVLIGGAGVLCRHNEIHDSAHAAILFGGNNHVMEYNEIYEVCKIADDSSAIYAGRDYTCSGNTVRYNFFHDMKSDADSHIGIFGMYCDDNLGSCSIEHNVFLRCQSALLLHGGHDMIFRGNLILDSCPKSVYSIRFHRYGYWDDLLPGGTHAAGLARVPWKGEIWRKAYPHLAEYLTWDPETEQCFPHYCDISSNAVVRHKPIDINFPWDDPRFRNRMEHNVLLDEAPEGTLEALCGEIFPKTIPGFDPIPFAEIGRGKTGGNRPL